MTNWSKFFIFIGLGLVLNGPAFAAAPRTPEEAMETMYHNDKSLVPSVSAEDVRKMIAGKNNFALIDVREAYEFAASSIPGAKLVPLSTLAERMADIPKNLPVVVYCRSGARSARAVAFLRGNGYDNVTNMTGGIMVWEAQSVASAHR